MKTKLLRIVPSSNKSKKWTAIFDTGDGKEKQVHFGSAGMRDYTLISNKSSKWYLPKILDRNVVKASYIRRHQKKEDWTNPLTPGALSRWLLWEKKTLPSAIKAFKKRFKL